MKKRLVGSAILGASLLFLSGCGGGSGSNPNEITFWNPFTGPDGTNMQAMIDEYNATDPEFPVNNLSMAEGDMYTRIPTVVNSGSGIPDLNIIHAERIVQYKDADMLTPFDTYLGDFPEINEENYVPEAWQIGDIDGERYSLPLDIHTFGLYYNPTLLEQYGPNVLDDEIVTFDEIRETAEKAKEDGITGFGITWYKPAFMSLLAQHGGDLTSDGQNPSLNTPEATEAFRLLQDLYSDGLTNEEGTDPMQMFLSDEILFFPEGIWMQNTMRDVDFEYGLTNFPQISDDFSNVANWSSSHQFVMLNNDERSEEKTQGIIQFIDWLRDNSIEWARAGQNPASLSLLDNEEYQNMPQYLFVSTPEQQDTLRIFDYKYNGYVSEYLDANGLDVVFGRISPEEAAQEIQTEVTDLIEQDSTGLQGSMEEEGEETEGDTEEDGEQ